jgi:hypothetical protein
MLLPEWRQLFRTESGPHTIDFGPPCPPRRMRFMRLPYLAATFGIAAALIFGPPVYATPANKRALADFFGPLAPAKAFDCRTCHVAEAPTDEDHDHNSFGARLAAVRSELRKAGKPTDMRARLQAIADEDSDGDGVANLVELLTGHSPGDAADKPSAAELQGVESLRVRLRLHLEEYQWRPFEPVRRPTVPAVCDSQFASGNPIDAFLQAARRERGLSARPQATKPELLRRVYLDLIGLPPTVAEQDAFEMDGAPDAYERVVDRLLASPRYGERWGRHWMDVWRYSDWAGYADEVRESQPHIWRWRDWIVESLNADLGYDQMVRQMLAGDEIAPTDQRTLRATGFLVRQYYKFNRNVVLDNTVEHTAKAFLGITLNCARCHDHKYDPLSQHEYYSFRAFFEPVQIRTDRVPGQPDTAKEGLVRAYDAESAPVTHLFIRGDEKTPDAAQICEPAVPASLGGPPMEIVQVRLPRDAAEPDRRAFVTEETRAAARQAVTAAEAGLMAARQHVARAVVATLGTASGGKITAALAVRAAQRGLDLARLDVLGAQAAYASLEATLKAEQAEDEGALNRPEGQGAAELAVIARRLSDVSSARRNLLAAENALEAAATAGRAAAIKPIAAARRILAEAEAAAVAPLNAAFSRRSLPKYPTTSSGRRLALARWITDRANPLAARVAVNHVWTRHFGEPLVPTVFDFGRNGQAPTHPALLDWLAAEFMDHGWRLKHLHRLIVTSAAYRADSRPDPASIKIDPDNRYLWRMNPRQMEAEVLRDSILHVAGRLNLTVGGPDLDQGQGLTTCRRSLYFRHANEKQMLFLTVFDAANVNECYRRTASIVPQQALALANSSLTADNARAVVERIGPTDDDAAFVMSAFRCVLGRPPTPAEADQCIRFLDAADPAKSRERLVRVLFNHHDFVTIR